jgi:TIR domain
MEYYIFLNETILKVRVEDGRVQNRMTYPKRVRAVDIQRKLEYTAEIECSQEVNLFKNLKTELAVLLFFKRHYISKTLNTLNSKNNVITLEIFDNLYPTAATIIEIQSRLISLLYTAFRIKPDISFSLDDLLVSTGYAQADLESALKYLIKMCVIKQKPGNANKNEYSLQIEIRNEYDRLIKTSPIEKAGQTENLKSIEVAKQLGEKKGNFDKHSEDIKIFLCYAHEDEEDVLKVYLRLKDEGFCPWMDKRDLLPGQNWRMEIPQVIKSSDFFLAFFSENSVSKRGYVQKEYKLAHSTLEEMPEGQIFLIPVRLGKCNIPASFKDIHRCDLFEENGIEKIIEAIKFQLEYLGI